MYEKHTTKFLTSNGLPVAASLELSFYDTAEIYYPGNYLIFVDTGRLGIEVDGEDYIVEEGDFLLVKKFTQAHYRKNWEADQTFFREFVFVLHDDFIKDSILSFPTPINGTGASKPVIKLTNSPILEAFMRSIEVYINTQVELDESMMSLKTREVLHGLLQAKPELIHTFIDFSQPAKADLLRFMEHSFTQNVSLEQFAQLSGRSLATFNRDFRKIFQMPPYQWIKQQRLSLAKRLLTYTSKTPSVVYLEVGFEDLAHFSRSFKQHFGINPSAIQKEVG